jgi:hypothetical protein
MIKIALITLITLPALLFSALLVFIMMLAIATALGFRD